MKQPKEGRGRKRERSFGRGQRRHEEGRKLKRRK